MTRYQKNLRVEGDKVYSYDTLVATIDRAKRTLTILGYWSKTTSKHLNYIATEFSLTKIKASEAEIKANKETEDEKDNGFKGIAMVAKMGEIFGKTKQEANNWKVRMLKAGLENRGFIMPEDWETLTENEKERRLNGVINELK